MVTSVSHQLLKIINISKSTKMAYLFKFILLNVDMIVILASEVLKLDLVLFSVPFLTVAINGRYGRVWVWHVT